MKQIIFCLDYHAACLLRDTLKQCASGYYEVVDYSPSNDIWGVMITWG